MAEKRQKYQTYSGRRRFNKIVQLIITSNITYVVPKFTKIEKDN